MFWRKCFSFSRLLFSDIDLPAKRMLRYSVPPWLLCFKSNFDYIYFFHRLELLHVIWRIGWRFWKVLFESHFTAWRKQNWQTWLLFSVFHEKINAFALNETSKSTKRMIVLNPRELSCSFKPLKGEQSKTMKTKKGNEIRRQVVQLRHLNWLIQTCFTCPNEYVAVWGISFSDSLHCRTRHFCYCAGNCLN